MPTVVMNLIIFQIVLYISEKIYMCVHIFKFFEPNGYNKFQMTHKSTKILNLYQ